MNDSLNRSSILEKKKAIRKFGRVMGMNLIEGISISSVFSVGWKTRLSARGGVSESQERWKCWEKLLRETE